MKKRNILIASASALAIAFGSECGQTLAQTPAKPPEAFLQLPKPRADKVSGPEISMLIRTTMVAIHQANITGNYTVLRDLGAMSFREINTPVKLGNLFAQIRDSGIDLSPAVLLVPLMTKPPVIDANGILVMEGFFPTRPQNILFKMGFRFEFGAWRLFTIGIGAQPDGEKPFADTKKAISTDKQKTGSTGKADAKPKVKPAAGQ